MHVVSEVPWVLLLIIEVYDPLFDCWNVHSSMFEICVSRVQKISEQIVERGNSSLDHVQIDYPFEACVFFFLFEEFDSLVANVIQLINLIKFASFPITTFHVFFTVKDLTSAEAHVSAMMLLVLLVNEANDIVSVATG